MTFDELKTILGDYAPASVLTLPAKSKLKSQTIEDLITTYLSADFVLNMTKPVEYTQTQVIFVGTAQLYTGSANFSATAIFQLVNGDPVMVVQSALAAGWTFGQTFSALKGTVLDKFGWTGNPLLILASTTSSSIDDPQIYSPGLNFNGNPTGTGPVTPVAFLFSDLHGITIYGVITFAQSNPVMALTSTAQQIPLTPINVTLNLTFLLSAKWTGAKQDIYYPSAALISDVVLKNGKSFPVALSLFSADMSLLLFDLVPGNYGVGDYSQLDQLANGTNLNALIPAELPSGVSLKLSALRIGVNPNISTLVSSVDIGVGLELSDPWTLIPKVLALSEVAVNFSVAFGSSAAGGSSAAPQISALIGGRFEIASTFDYDVSIRLPEMILTGTLPAGSTIPLGDLIQHFLGPVDGISGLEVFEFDFSADVRNKAYYLTAGVANVWKVSLPLVTLDIQELDAAIAYSTNQLILQFEAYWLLDGIPLMASAQRPAGDNGWDLGLGTQPGSAIEIIGLVKNFLGPNTQFPSFVPQTLTLTNVLFAGNTKTQNYTIEAATSAGWDLDLKTGVPAVKLDASFYIESTTTDGGPHRAFALVRQETLQQPTRSYSGNIQGSLTIYSFLAKVIYDFSPNNKTLTFQFAYRGATLTAVWYIPQQGQDSVVTVNLGGVTFGEILEYLVNLVDPNLGFKLESPWDVLNKISFDNLMLTINLTKKTVGIAYKLDLDLVLFKLTSVGLTYQSKAANGKTVVIDITGQFLDKAYGAANPLSWDMLNDPPPAIPGKGSQLFDLRYAGIGQNVGFRSVKNFDTVASVITTMEKDFPPADSSNQNPLANNSALRFTGDGRWLVGADFTLINTLTLSFIFADPNLYGLRIAILQGGKIQVLAGLEFELLYKKVTDTIGVYQIELKLPDAMRQIQLGAVSLTLPIIDIDIYTNGNFRIDMGFPVNMDFSRSFGVQVWPFIGAGGFYFALLNGQTSDKVPKISSGNFSPVIEAGIGLSIGVGKTINEGVLQAGLSLTLEVVLEGVLGWYNPTSTAEAHAMFYYVNGTAALVGKLYGTVDFVIIKASVSVVLYAQIQLIIEAYQPIFISATVGVEVQASLKILLFTVHFSFKAQVHTSFTIGSASTPPWTVISGTQTSGALRLRQQRTHYRRRVTTATDALRVLRARSVSQESFDWTPRNVFGGETVSISLTLAPSFTVATPGPVSIGAAAAGATASPRIEAVMGLFTGNSIQPEARTAREVRSVLAGPRNQPAPFTLLASGFLKWMIGAVTTSDFITSVDLEVLYNALSNVKTRDQVFSYAQVSNFIGLNYGLDISTPLAGPTGPTEIAGTSRPEPTTANGPIGFAGTQEATRSAVFGVTGVTGLTGATGSVTAFPMIPELIMMPQGQSSVNFKDKSLIGEQYEDKLSAYFNQLLVNVEKNNAQDPKGAPNAATVLALRGATGPVESMATFLFRDYFAMLSMSALQSASNLLRRFPYPVTPSDSLSTIVKQFPPVTAQYQTQPGDTLDAISLEFGVTVDAIRAANPWLAGFADTQPLPSLSTLTLNLSVNVQELASANQSVELRASAVLQLSGVQYQLRSGDTFCSISQNFGLLPIPVIGQNNAANKLLLRPTATMLIPQGQYAVVAGDSLALIASVYVARKSGVDSSYFGWYVQRIIELNPGVIVPVFPPGVLLTIPVAAMTANGFEIQTTTVTYTTKDQDTVELIAGYFVLQQLDPSQFAAFAQLIQQLNPGVPIQPGSVLTIPSFSYTVVQGDSLASIAAIFWQTAGTLANANASTKQLLSPLAVIALPQFPYTIQTGDTLASIAALFDLTLDDFSKTIATQGGIFQRNSVLTVPSVPQLRIDQLLQQMELHPSTTGWESSYNEVSATVSRFLLGGMRVPEPSGQKWRALTVERLLAEGATGIDLYSLYDVSGQQFAAPPDTTALYEIAFAKGGTAPWVQFSGPSGPVASLDVKLTASDLKDNYPSPVFDPQIISGPSRLTLLQETPFCYNLSQSLHWQSAAPPQLSIGPTGTTGHSGATEATGQVGQAAGEPSIWLFPDTLLAAIGTGPTGGSPPYELLQTTSAADGSTSKRALSTYAWAAAVPLQVQQAKSQSGDPLANGYLMLGADQTGSQVLLDAWSYLAAASYRDDATLYLLYTPNETNGNGKGLASDQLDLSNTYLLKTNLSTVTHSGPSNMAFGDAGNYYSTIASAEAFLKYLWECSIVGSGGFYLNYVNSDGGAGLPADIFANGASVQLWLLVVLRSQSRPTNPNRSLYSFNNCAVLGGNLDASSSALYVQLQNPGPQDLTRTSTVPQGVAGFLLSRKNPDTSGLTGPAYRTSSLYNLLGFQVAENSYFRASNEGLPVMPGKNDEADFAPLAAPSYVNTDDSIWSYHQAVPISQFGKFNVTPDCAALPARSANPYAGLTGPMGPTGPFSQVTFDLAFHDVYGNQTTPVQPVGPLAFPVGYLDPVIGLASWPGAAGQYLFTPDATGPQLSSLVSLQLSKYIPGPAVDFNSAAYAASTDVQRYKQIYYQLSQPDVALSLQTTVDQANSQVAPAAYPLAKQPFTNFIQSSFAFLNTAQNLEQAVYKTPPGSSQTLDAVGKLLSVDLGALGEANHDLPAAALFQTEVAVPAYHTMSAMDTLSSIVTGVTGPFGPPSCPVKTGAEEGPWGPATLGARMRRISTDAPTGATAITVQQLAENNSSAPLTPARDLKTASRAYTVPLNIAPDGNTLAQIAASQNASVLAAFGPLDPVTHKPSGYVGLIESNYGATGILAPGNWIRIDKHVTETDGNSTFENLYDFFQPFGIELSEFAQAVQSIEGVFTPGVTIQVADYIVQQGDTLSTLPAALGTLDDLANWNQTVPGIFKSGTALYLTYQCYSPGAAETLQSIAADSGITLDQLMEANATAPLTAGQELAVPSLIRIDPAQTAYAAYTTTGNQSFSDIASLFGITPPAFANLNRFLQNLFVPGVPLTIGTAKVTTQSGSTFDSLYQAFLAQIPNLLFDDFANDIAPTPKLVSAGVAVFGPLPTIPSTGGVSNSLLSIAQAFNLQPVAIPQSTIDAVTLVQVNSALQGFLLAGAQIFANSTQSLPATAYDTFATMVSRFKKELKIDTSVADLATLNQSRTGILSSGARFLLPPNSVSLTTAITPRLPQAIFPVTVEIDISRSTGMIDPEFDGVDAVQHAIAPLAPVAIPGSDGTLLLTTFAQNFEKAFSAYNLKAATGKTGNVAESFTSARQIWAVNFGAGGISQFQIQAQSPAFYALRPLSTQLISRSAWVRDYVSGQGLLPHYQQKQFRSIDLDAWMQDFLSAVDMVLTPNYALSGFQLSVGPTGSTGVTGGFAAPPASAIALPGNGPSGFAFDHQLPRLAMAGGGATGATGSGGRAAFENIVAAKDTVAGALENYVSNILFNPLPPQNPYLQDAQQVLGEQMLVNLLSGYSVDAVVQYPVSVTANLPGGIPPRVSGKLLPIVCTTLSVLSLQTLATTNYTVDVSYLASVLIDVRYIIQPGVTLGYGGLSMTTSSSDTLASIATALGVTPDTTAPGFWETWTPFIAAIGTQAIVAAHVSIPLTGIRRQITTADTVNTLADYLNLSAAAFAEANSDLPGIFIPNSKIVVDQVPYTVGTGDKLSGILTALQKQLPQLTLAEMAVAIADQQNLVNPQQVVHAVQLLPDLSLSTAKVSLGPLPLLPNPPLTFLLNIKQPMEYRKVFLNLSYIVNELEYEIRDVSGVDGYQASSWLSFLLPFAPATIGQVEIPLPLRSYPTPPTMLAQAGSASYPQAVTIPDARLWDYSFTYRTNNAAQDTDFLEVTFNGTGDGGPRFDAGSPDPFPALAQFADVYAALKNDLALLPQLAPGSQNHTAAIAFQTFAEICSLVAGAFTRAATVKGQTGPPPESYEFRLDTRTDSTGKQLHLLTLTLESYSAPAGMAGMTGGLWPEILVEPPAGPMGATGFEPLTLISSNNTKATYEYPAGIAAFTPLTSRFVFRERDLIRNQNAWSGVYLTRNQDLISSGPLGATGGAGITGAFGPVPTNPQFVYETPVVRFVNPMQLLLVNQNVIPVDQIQGPGNTLVAYLTKMFTQLLDSGSFTIEVACDYAFEVGEPGSGLFATTPILMAPQVDYNPATAQWFITQLAGAITRWTQANQPNPTGGSFVFDVKVFAQTGSAGPTGATGAAVLQSMLELQNLQLGMTAIQPPITNRARISGGTGGAPTAPSLEGDKDR